MQALTASPRDHLTEDDVFELLTGDELEISAGLELLDSSNRYVDDISTDLVVDGSKVSQDGRATIHRSCTLKLQRSLAWGRDRVLPYMTLSNGAVTARFNLGVYVLTTPRTRNGETPATWDVTGYDLLSVLDEPVGDTYVVEPAAGAEQVKNPVFATNTADWGSNPSFGAYTSATFVRSTSAPYGGTGLRITWPNEGTAGQSWVSTYVPGMVVGKAYKVTAKIWVPAGGPNEFRLDAVFRGSSGWVTVPKEQLVTLEWVWTCTYSNNTMGLATRDCVAGQQTWLKEFHVEPLSTTCLDAVQAVLGFAGAGAPLRLDGTEQVAALPGPMVWAVTDGSPSTWLDVVNDLLAAVNYNPLWVDENGTFRSEPYLDPKTRPVEWTLDAGDARTTLVGQEREIDEDVWSAPNWWRFVRRGIPTAPTEGAGLYTVQNLGRGASSQQSLGRIRRKVTFLDAVDQASLVAQGDRIVVEDTSITRTVTLGIEPLPSMGHRDVVQYVDGAFSHKAEVVAAEVCLDGTPGRWVLEVVD